MSTFWIIVVAGLLMVLIAFPFIIFPILAFVNCLRNQQLSTQSKIGWACLIFFTWTLGAAIYGIVVSQRPFYRTMGILCACLMVGALIAKKPLERYTERNSSRRASIQQVRSTELQGSHKANWDRLAPIYANFGMTDVWTLYQSGQCQEGKKLLEANWPSYQAIIVKKSGGKGDGAIYRDMANKGFDACEQYKQESQAH